jgi:hypothetical protein
MTRCGGWLAAAVALGALAAAALAETAEDGAVLGGDPLLKAPEGVAGPVETAKTPPSVYVRFFRDLPDGGKGTLWSNWGEACIASNGRYYAPIGDHLDIYGGTGQSRIYEFDPVSRALRVAVNTRDVIPDPKLAGGKIHARVQQAAGGWIYFATYWGKIPKQADWDAGFKGSALLRFDPKSGKTEFLGVPVPQQGLPTSLMDPQRGLIYFYAVYSGDLVVYDISKREVKYRGSADIQSGSRNIILDLDGNAYFSTKDGRLARYNPATNQVAMTKAQMPASARPPRESAKAKSAKSARSAKAEPAADAVGADAAEDAKAAGSSLRSSSRAARDGIIYGMTHAGQLFAFDPKAETITDLGPNFQDGYYCAHCVLSPDEKYLYYAPGSHGSGVSAGAPVVQYDIAAKRRKVLAFLGPVMRERLAYNIGGTFNLTITADGGTLIGTFNGSPYDPAARRGAAFGRPSIVMIEIPKSER